MHLHSSHSTIIQRHRLTHCLTAVPRGSRRGRGADGHPRPCVEVRVISRHTLTSCAYSRMRRCSGSRFGGIAVPRSATRPAVTLCIAVRFAALRSLATMISSQHLRGHPHSHGFSSSFLLSFQRARAASAGPIMYRRPLHPIAVIVWLPAMRLVPSARSSMTVHVTSRRGFHPAPRCQRRRVGQHVQTEHSQRPFDP